MKRFFDKIYKNPNGCWEWTGAKLPKGYGVFSVEKITGWGTITAHKFSWILHNGIIPRGMCILHKCDNPPCVNPEHLLLGTISDNNKDMAIKKRGKNQNSYMTHCKRGHELGGNNVIPSDKRRRCRKCILIRKHKYYLKAKENKCLTS